MTRKVLILAVIFGLAGATLLWAQSPSGAPGELGAVKADLERIKADLEDVKRQLTQILRLMTQRGAQGAPPATAGPVRASLGDVPALGRPDAPVTLVEFSDYQCPFWVKSEPCWIISTGTDSGSGAPPGAFARRGRG